MTSSINKIVESIQDSRQARIKFTLHGGNQHHLDAIFKTDTPPYFFLVFPPNSLPENIDIAANHPVSISQESRSISLNATVMEVVDDRTVHFAAKGTLDPASLREYFRVNSSTGITVSYTSGTTGESSSKRWSITGVTQDLSGSGVLALFPDEPKNKNDIVIEILLPKKEITVVGHIVRKKILRSKRWQVSLHFDNISTKHRDAILAYLLSEQRKQLRENVNVLG